MKRTQLWLSLVGCLCSLAGALLLSAASVPSLVHELNPAAPVSSSTVYVSGDSCFTCHPTGDGWSEGVHPRVIDSPIVNPHPVASSAADVATTRLIINSPAQGQTVSAQPVGGQAISPTPRQQYVVETDSGTRVLAGHWLLGGQLVYLPDPDSSQTEACIDCHATPSAPKRSSPRSPASPDFGGFQEERVQ